MLGGSAPALERYYSAFRGALYFTASWFVGEGLWRSRIASMAVRKSEEIDIGFLTWFENHSLEEASEGLSLLSPVA